MIAFRALLLALLIWAVPAQALDLYRETFTFTRQISSAPYFWISDLPNAPGPPDAANMELPPWFPRKAYIDSCSLRYEGTLAGQYAGFIDKGGLSYATGDPPYHQTNGDFRRDSSLCSLNIGQTEGRWEYEHPYLLDRDAGDRFWVQLDGSQGGIYTFKITYLLPVVSQPAAAVPSGWTPTAAWNEALGNGAGEGDAGGWSGWTLLIPIDSPGVVFGSGSSDTRVSFRAGNGGAWTIAKAYIGPRDGTSLNAASLTQIKFGAADGVNIAAGATMVSDPLGAAITGTSGYIVKVYTSGNGTVRTLANQPAWRVYYKSGDDAASAASTGYTLGTARGAGVTRIEALF